MHMIKFNIESYLKIPGSIVNLKEVNNVPNKYFMSIEKALEDTKFTASNPEYFEGVIFIEYNDVILMDFTLYDYIVPLWAYFVNLLEDLIDSNYAQTYFPDQPIKIEVLDLLSGYVKLSIEINEKKDWILPKRDFYQELIKGAMSFFELLLQYTGDNRYLYEIERIKKIQNKIKIS